MQAIRQLTKPFKKQQEVKFKMKQNEKRINKNNLYLTVFITIILFIINIYSINKYFIYNKVLNEENSIEYVFLDKTKHSGGKGEHYDMRISYLNNVYRVSITYKIFTKIDKGELPKLFITPQNEVITNWNMTIAKRGIIASFIGLFIFILVLIYFRFIKR